MNQMKKTKKKKKKEKRREEKWNCSSITKRKWLMNNLSFGLVGFSLLCNDIERKKKEIKELERIEKKTKM